MIRNMHLQFRSFLLGYILILCICLQISPFIGATFKPLGNFCQNTPTYTPNTTYEANLKSLLPTLSSHANRQNGFFTAGDHQDTVYGLFMCRGDVSAADCGACVSDASATVLQRCPNQKTATIWYDFCTLSYSDGPVYGIPNPSFVPFYLYNGNKDSRPDSFMMSVNKTLTQLAARVVNDQSAGRNFATEEGNFTESERIYSLAQCRPDIGNRDCETCLRKAIEELQSCCYSRLSATALSLDCYMKYATEPFYTSTAAPAPPPIPCYNNNYYYYYYYH
ncbi:cysteine-rich receptor-like protein kinase 25 [Ipomoea triloba]|uniref:cysteine-rich receptor-like protein kinase 25 n=1 Tax=Ipomoea triloba TaxID=35885 RepID=UPI00125E124E|nr:cysteine-rich receptor-like protein kinase 25 [Ipomoea triloba]